MTKRTATTTIALCSLALAGVLLSGCKKDADVVSHNLSEDADNFRIMRRITFYNSMQGSTPLLVEGLCALGNTDTQLRMSVTCKTGPAAYKKHMVGLAPTMFFIAEQIEAAPSNPYQYSVTFKPTVLVPNPTISFPGVN